MFTIDNPLVTDVTNIFNSSDHPKDSDIIDVNLEEPTHMLNIDNPLVTDVTNILNSSDHPKDSDIIDV